MLEYFFCWIFKVSDAPVEPPKPVKKVMPERNNAENFSQSESMVINAMLQRTTLFKNNDSESGSDSEWVNISISTIIQALWNMFFKEMRKTKMV